MRRFALVKSLTGAAMLAATLAVAPLGAQSFRGRGGNDGVPEGHRPPPGMCRIWIDGVPPGQQPAPTDCASAVRNRPANGRVIFGDDAAKSGKVKPRKFSGAAYQVDDERPAGSARASGRRHDAEHADRRNDDDRDSRARHSSDDTRSDGDDNRRDSRRKPN